MAGSAAPAASKALLTHSCTAALEMAALLLDLQPGDEVIMPSFTFVSTANAFVLRGAVPVFVDIRADTLNIDEALIEAAITPRTKAICVVHYAGVGCEMDAIMAIAAAPRPDGGRGRRAGHLLDLQGPAAGQHRRTRRAELPRDQERHLRRRRRAAGQRSGAWSSAPRSSARKAPTAASSSAARSTSTPGSTSARRTCRARSSPRSSRRSSRRPTTSPRRRLALWDRYHAWAAPLEAAGPAAPPDRPGGLHAQRAHVLPAAAVAGSAHARSSTTLKERGIGAVFHYVPLHSSPAGQRYGAYARRAWRSPTTSATGWCGCRCGSVWRRTWKRFLMLPAAP